MKEKIIEAIERHVKPPENWLEGKQRGGMAPKARFFFYYFYREIASMEGRQLTPTEIGYVTGHDRNTVIYGLTKIEDFMGLYDDYRKIHNAIAHDLIGANSFTLYFNGKRVDIDSNIETLDRVITHLRLLKAERMTKERYG